MVLDYQKLLAGKRAFITTGSRGIGKEIAMLFARHGAVVAVGGRNAAGLAATIDELSELSPCTGYPFDLSNADETESVLDKIIADFGGMDILVNTVGVNCRSRADMFEDEVLERLLETNYKSGLRCIRKLAPGMIERKSGSIINISSIHGDRTMPTFMMYAGTKSAMNGAARAAALDFAPHLVRVNVISPGLILSDNMMDEVNSYAKGEERDAFMKILENMQPLPPGSSEDVANAALFLASDMSAYITGQTIFVDGGATVKAHP